MGTSLAASNETLECAVSAQGAAGRTAQYLVVATEKAPVPEFCVMAGTLLHTSKGPVPIEKLEAGDQVLSQPETKGEQASKPVEQTLSVSDKEIHLVRFYKESLDNGIEQVGVTANHPFWVKDVGWLRADQLDNGVSIELIDGSEATILCSVELHRTTSPISAWAVGAWGIECNDGSGNLVHFHVDGAIEVDLDDVFNWEILDNENQSSRFCAPVYDIKVKDFHTYYIGERGVWVHSTSCVDNAA